MVIGLTGGIGCGKSTAARMFAERGFALIDTDQIVRDAHAQPEVAAALRDRYGSRLGAGEAIDRKLLAGIIFADDGERSWLEELLHPVVFAAWRQRLAGREGERWVVETPLLFEGALEIWFDFTVCVACAPEQQLVRLEQRGLNRALAGQRISKQLPLTRKVDLAEFVLWNDGSREFLQQQVDRLVASAFSR